MYGPRAHVDSAQYVLWFLHRSIHRSRIKRRHLRVRMQFQKRAHFVHLHPTYGQPASTPQAVCHRGERTCLSCSHTRLSSRQACGQLALRHRRHRLPRPSHRRARPSTPGVAFPRRHFAERWPRHFFTISSKKPSGVMWNLSSQMTRHSKPERLRAARKSSLPNTQWSLFVWFVCHMHDICVHVVICGLRQMRHICEHFPYANRIHIEAD